MNKYLKKVVLTLILLMTFVFNLCVGVMADAQTERSDYEPRNVMTTAIGSGVTGVNVSWVNPKAALSGVKIYKLNSSGDAELLDESLNTTSDSIVVYSDSSVAVKGYATYKLHFDFADGTIREVYTSGMASSDSNTNFTADPSTNEDYAGAMNAIRVLKSNGFKSTLDFVSELYNADPETNVMRIRTNDEKNSTNNYDLSLWGTVKTSAGTALPGRYKVGMTAKGSSATVTLYLQGFRGSWQNIAWEQGGTIIGGGDWEYKETSEIVVQDNVTLPWNRLIVRIGNIDPGELLVDNIKILRFNEDTNSWDEVSVQEFDYRATGAQSVTPNPKDVDYEHTTEGVIIKWTVPEVRTIKNGFTDQPSEFGTYTNVYEEIGPQQYLRATLYNSGKTEDNVLIKNVGTGRFILKTFRRNSLGDQDLEGDGSYSDGVVIEPVEPASVADDIFFKDADGNVCDSIAKGSYTACVNVRNIKEDNMTGQLIAALYKGKKMMGIYKTDPALIPQTSFNEDCTKIQIENIVIPDVDLSDYSLRLMFWDDAFGAMHSLSDGKKIEMLDSNK